MKIARFNGDRIGVIEGDRIVDVSAACGIEPAEWPPVGIARMIASFSELRPKIEAAAKNIEMLRMRFSSIPAGILSLTV